MRRLMARLGAGGATVDTVLDTPTAMPGTLVTGQVRLTGGSVAQDVTKVVVGLQAVVETEVGDHEWREDVQFAAQAVTGAFRLEPGARHAVPFSLAVPWQCPVTAVGGWHLRGMSVGVRTTVDIAGAVDPGDLDPLTVVPLPAQDAVLGALADLGFRFKTADVERGRIAGSDLPFYQEVEFAPPHALARSISELEVTFLADPHGLDVVLEADRRGGLLTEGHDAYARIRLAHNQTDRRAVAGMLDGEIRRLGQRRGWSWL